LSEGRHGYLVRRTFVPDDKLEEKFINDKKKEVNSVFCIFILFVYLFIYKYSNMSFKQKVYEDDMGDKLVQEHNDLNTSDQEKNCT
jgi:hypothetical protein